MHPRARVTWIEYRAMYYGANTNGLVFRPARRVENKTGNDNR